MTGRLRIMRRKLLPSPRGKRFHSPCPSQYQARRPVPTEASHTSPGTAFLMTMFNVCLGWWFANPLIKDKGEGKENWEVIGPKCGFLSLLSELLASSRDDLPQVYLSDGGHFENLGFDELAPCRCRYIIVCDADADPKFEFEDIGNAIRKIRIDFGIDIEIDTRSPRPRSTDGAEPVPLRSRKNSLRKRRQELQRAPRVAWISPQHQAEPHRRRARRRVAIRGRQQGFPASNHA